MPSDAHVVLYRRVQNYFLNVETQLFGFEARSPV